MKIEDFLPELAINSAVLQKISSDNSLNATYCFNKTGKANFDFGNCKKPNTAIHCCVRKPNSAKFINDEMRIKKIELKELCIKLANSINSSSVSLGFQNFMQSTLILAHDNNNVCKFVSIYPDLSINLIPIKPVNILLRSLNTEYGFLGIDSTSKKSIILEHDESAIRNMPLIGVWTKLNEKYDLKQKHEIIMGAMLKFLLCENMGPKVSQEKNTFIYAEFSDDKEKSKFYSFQVKSVSDLWIMLVSSFEISDAESVTIKLTTNKRIAKEQGNCYLYKLPKTIYTQSDKDKKRPSSSIRSYKEINNKENLDIRNSNIDKARISTKSVLRNIDNRIPLRQNILNNLSSRTNLGPSCNQQLTNRSSLIECNKFPLNTKMNVYNREDRPKSAYGRYQKPIQRTSSVAFAKKIISQQQTQIQLLQKQIMQVMSTLQVMGKSNKKPVSISFKPSPLFELNNRFKENMDNCQQLNIDNNLNQDSPNFMKVGRNDNRVSNPILFSKFIRRPESKDVKIIEAPTVMDSKMLSSIKETNESVGSLDGNSIKCNKNSKVKRDNNFAVFRIKFNEKCN